MMVTPLISLTVTVDSMVCLTAAELPVTVDQMGVEIQESTENPLKVMS